MVFAFSYMYVKTCTILYGVSILLNAPTVSHVTSRKPPGPRDLDLTRPTGGGGGGRQRRKMRGGGCEMDGGGWCGQEGEKVTGVGGWPTIAFLA